MNHVRALADTLVFTAVKPHSAAHREPLRQQMMRFLSENIRAPLRARLPIKNNNSDSWPNSLSLFREIKFYLRVAYLVLQKVFFARLCCDVSRKSVKLTSCYVYIAVYDVSRVRIVTTVLVISPCYLSWRSGCIDKKKKSYVTPGFFSFQITGVVFLPLVYLFVCLLELP